ncbi:glycerophosphodiester phosphodiesterase [Sphingomonas sp. ID0503]|uniref:glycerophosphodiester phosphodiesterase n=1 Tax=Sphingomonas sp. ID0503 TaxID=3399691 RepID=UPI003AFB2061
MLIAALAFAAAFGQPLVIAHRGASGERPEHTLAAYALAIEEGADFIESDAVMTRDHVLVARHENEIGGTTDVAAHPQFAGRRTTKTIDGQPLTGWFTEDFTLAELKTLHARERLPELRGTAHDGRDRVPTLQEVIDLIRAEEKKRGRVIGYYVETKHPSYFRNIGFPLEEPLVALLEKNGYRTAADPIFIESFEVANLKALQQRTAIRLIQLMDAEGRPADTSTTYADMATPEGLKTIATYAYGVGPAKALIVPRDAEGRSLAPTRFIADAHEAGLKVHPWTFRSENAFLPAELHKGDQPATHGDAAAEVRQFIALGVDGFFSDFPADAIAARKSETNLPSTPD